MSSFREFEHQMQDRCFGLAYHPTLGQPEFGGWLFNTQIMPDFSEMSQKPSSDNKISRWHLAGIVDTAKKIEMPLTQTS